MLGDERQEAGPASTDAEPYAPYAGTRWSRRSFEEFRLFKHTIVWAESHREDRYFGIKLAAARHIWA